MLMLSQHGMMSKAGGAPPPVAFTPAALPGTLLWVRSDLGVSLISDGTEDRLFSWADQSPSANHLFQNTVAQRPFWSTGAIAGRPVADLRGAQILVSTLACNAMWTVQGDRTCEIWLVYRPNANQSGSFFINVNQSSSTNALQFRWNASDIQVAYRNHENNSLVAGAVTTPVPAVGSSNVARVQRTSPAGGPGTVKLWLNRTLVDQVGDAREFVLGGGGSTPFVVGGREDLSNVANAGLAELWLGKTELSASEADDLDAYGLDIYGL